MRIFVYLYIKIITKYLLLVSLKNIQTKNAHRLMYFTIHLKKLFNQFRHEKIMALF